MIKMKGLRHREGEHYSKVLMGKHHKDHKDAGGSVPPAGAFKEGGAVKRRTGGRVEGASARSMDEGHFIGKRSGSNPSHELDTGKPIGKRATGGAIRRAMGGVGKLRHDECGSR